MLIRKFRIFFNFKRRAVTVRSRHHKSAKAVFRHFKSYYGRCGVSPNGHKIPIKYDPSTDLLVIPNCAYLGPYSEGVWEYTIVNYATLDFKSNYVSYSLLEPYYIYFTFRYEAGKYTLDLYNSAPMFNKSRVSTGVSIYKFSAEEGVTLSSANRVGSVIGLIFPTFTQQ